MTQFSAKSEPELLGCGVDKHDDDCLCDVIIVTPTPINIRCGIADLRYGHEVARIRGYTQDWADGQVLDYLCDVVFANDEMRSGGWDKLLALYDPTIRDVKSNGWAVSEWQVIRQCATSLLAMEHRPTIRNVLVIMGITAEQFTQAVTTNKFVRDAEWLDEFEKVCLDTGNRAIDISRHFNMSYDATRNFMTYWGRVPKINRKPRKKYTRKKGAQNDY